MSHDGSSWPTIGHKHGHAMSPCGHDNGHDQKGWVTMGQHGQKLVTVAHDHGHAMWPCGHGGVTK